MPKPDPGLRVMKFLTLAILCVGWSLGATGGTAEPLAAASPPSLAPATPIPTTEPVSAAELVKTYRNSLVFVNGEQGSGSGFLAAYGGGNYVFTNAHVAAGIKGAGFKTLEGTSIKVGAASVAVGHDIFLLQSNLNGKPFEVMKGVDQNTTIGDEVVVLGNAEGAGVINTIMGKIVGVGPQLVEVDAPFVPGNSGSPIIHLKTGKVIGVATYLTIEKYDPATKQAIKDPIVRRFGYRIDSVKTWQPVNWPALYAQAAEMDGIEKLTDDLDAFLRDLIKTGRVNANAHSNPLIKNRIDAWRNSKGRQASATDRNSADQSFLAFLKVTCQTDVAAARQHMTYDYFQRALADQQQTRNQMSEFFSKVIEDMKKDR